MSDSVTLNLLAAVCAQNKSTATLSEITGLDAAGLSMALATAHDSRLVAPTGRIHPPLVVTDQGRDWVARKFPFIGGLFQ